MYSSKGKGKKSKVITKATPGAEVQQIDDKHGQEMDNSNNGKQGPFDTEFQKLCSSVENQEKHQEQMYQDLKLIFQELIQQKIERQDFIQKQEHVITELQQTIDAKLDSSVLQMKEELKEMQSSIIKKIESSRNYVKDVKDFKEAMLNKLDEERNYLKGKIRDVQKDLMSKIIDVTQISDEGLRELLGRSKSAKSKLSWFSKRGDHRRGAEFEQNEDQHKSQEDTVVKTETEVEHQNDEVNMTPRRKVEQHNEFNMTPRSESEEKINKSPSYERIDEKIHNFTKVLEVSPIEEFHAQVNKQQTRETSQDQNVRPSTNLKTEGEAMTDALSQIESREEEQSPSHLKSQGAHSSSKEIIAAIDSVQEKFQGSCQHMQQEILDSVEDKLERVMRSVDISLIAAKHEVLDMVEKEAQLIRDRLSHKYQPRPTYTCDFYVKYIRDMIKNGDSQTGPPWHIDQLGSCVKGYVETVANGDMYVTIMYGRHPTALGMTPRPAIKLKVKATIKDLTGSLPDVVVGEVVWYCDEAGIKDNRIRGKKIGVVSCRGLLSKGYGEREGYGFCSLLVRYDIMVSQT